MDALVTEAHARWSVAGIRGLGRAGLEVTACAPRWSAAGRWSRYVQARELVPDAGADAAGYVAGVARLARKHGPLVVFPGYEQAIDLLLAARLPPEAILPYPPAEATQRLRDKRALAEFAAAAGLRAPRTLAQGAAAELLATPPPTPCVVKAARRGGELNETLVARTDSELRAIAARLPASEPLLVQELAPGPLSGLSLVLARDGAPVARFQQVTRRTWPPGAGGSAVATSVVPDEQLVGRCARMLAASGYWGLAQLQFLQAAAGPALIDVNTRFYGSLPLALAAGVNLPAAWHAVALERDLPPPGPYRVGVTYRCLEMEIAAAFRGSWKVLAQRMPRPRVGAAWAADDPLPGAILGLEAAALKLRNRLPRAHG